MVDTRTSYVQAAALDRERRPIPAHLAQAEGPGLAPVSGVNVCIEVRSMERAFSPAQQAAKLGKPAHPSPA